MDMGSDFRFRSVSHSSKVFWRLLLLDIRSSATTTLILRDIRLDTTTTTYLMRLFLSPQFRGSFESTPCNRIYPPRFLLFYPLSISNSGNQELCPIGAPTLRNIALGPSRPLYRLKRTKMTSHAPTNILDTCVHERGGEDRPKWKWEMEILDVVPIRQVPPPLCEPKRILRGDRR